jgi:hypothetical protein
VADLCRDRSLLPPRNALTDFGQVWFNRMANFFASGLAGQSIETWQLEKAREPRRRINTRPVNFHLHHRSSEPVAARRASLLGVSPAWNREQG